MTPFLVAVVVLFVGLGLLCLQVCRENSDEDEGFRDTALVCAVFCFGFAVRAGVLLFKSLGA